MGEYLTVKELIQKLSELQQDANVYVYGSCGAGVYGGRSVDVKYKEGWFCEEDRTCVEIWGHG